jgi:hypothetical protein
MQIIGALQQAPGAACPHLKALQTKVYFDDVYERPTQGQGPFCAGLGCTSLCSNFHLVLMQ